MKNIILCLIIASILNSCSYNQKRGPAEEATTTALVTPIDPEIGIQIEEFQNLVEESMVWREKSVAFARAHVNELGKKLFTNSEMMELYSSVNSYLVLRQKILDSAYRYQELVDSYTFITLNTGKRTYDKVSNTKNNGSELHVLYLDPLDDKGRDLLSKMKISLAASLVLYDNYMVGIYPYQQQKKIRKLLNEDLPGQSSELEKITENFFSMKNRTKVHTAVKLFQNDIELKKLHNIQTHPKELYLEALIQQSAFYQYVATGKRNNIETKGLRAFMTLVSDRIRATRDSLAFTASKILGNTVGFFAFRDGKLKNLSNNEKDFIVSKMQPLDILLEKTPFRLTDHLIPGYYGHVAIWAGNEDELKSLGVWDHPKVQPYQAQIREGKRIIEALRPGVEINTLDHFLNIDDLLVLRDQKLNEATRKEFIIRAFSQIGKEYDFNFDVETDKKIVCSEIVYTVFNDIAWPTKKSLGRFTISPDNVVMKAVGDYQNKPELEAILMYKSGSIIEGDYITHLKKLLKIH